MLLTTHVVPSNGLRLPKYFILVPFCAFHFERGVGQFRTVSVFKCESAMHVVLWFFARLQL